MTGLLVGASLALAAAASWSWWRARKGVDCDDTLSRLFEFSRKVGREGDLQDVLRAIVDTIYARGELDAVLLRLYNSRTLLYEARAFAGLDDQRIGQLSNQDVTAETFARLAERAQRIAHSHRLGASPNQGAGFADECLIPGCGEVVLVPLLGDEGNVVGYLCAQLRAEATETHLQAQVMLLEAFAILAVSAIRNARLHTELEHKKLELSLASEKLKELKRLKENFVGTVSHELRTPLTSVKAYAETLSRSYGEMDAATAREFTEIIVKESDRLNQIFDDILDVEQLETGRLRMMADDFSLRDLAGEVVEDLGAEFDKNAVEFELLAPSHDVVLHADRASILQVLKNLLANAIKFTPAAGDIKMSLEEDVSMVRVVVEDAGIGIPEEEMERIFDRFHQVDNSPTRAYGGQGLGLAICRDIVRWHGGRIWAERSVLGGARIVVLLPRKGFVISPGPADAADPTERMERQNFLHLVTSLVSETMGARIVSLMLVDGEELRIEAAVGLEEEVVRNTKLRAGEGVAGTVWHDGAAILVPDLDADARFAGRINEIQYTTRSLLSCPIQWKGRFLGVINVNNKVDGRDLDYDDLLLLELLAESVGCSLCAFEEYQVGHRRLFSVNEALRAIVDVGRERRTRLREQLVRCGLETARRLQLTEDELRPLAFALRIYDLGLSKVSEQILRKVAPLSAEERERIEDHVHVGAELAAGLEPSPRMLRILVHHHENFDGSGYPDGLSGEAIPVGARIVRLVDAVGAALHDHPFRKRLQYQEALHILSEGVGRRFCPRITPIFLEVLEDRRDELVETLDRRLTVSGRPSPAAVGSREEP